jgi:hypothetical protein
VPYTIKLLDYFIYNGTRYVKGTEMMLTDYAYSQYGIVSIPKPCVIFIGQNENCSEIYCLVKGQTCILIPNNKTYIQRIIKPIYYSEQPAIESAVNNFVTKKKTPDIFNGMLWYIFIMMFLLFCNNGFIFMIIATVIFARWLIKKYKN